MTLEAVLFDLDGTLVDSAPDLVAVLNQLLVEEGRPRMPYAIARNEASNGALGLLRLGFGDHEQPQELDALRRRFVELYATMLCVKSRLFIELSDIVKATLDMPWGIVTNKPHAMTMPLLERLGIHELAACVVSGDRLPQRKPHPAPLQLAAQELGVAPAQCVYVGDAARDIEAGKAAGMRTIAAAYGYIRQSENCHSWNADRVIRHPRELATALGELKNRAATPRSSLTISSSFTPCPIPRY